MDVKIPRSPAVVETPKPQDNSPEAVLEKTLSDYEERLKKVNLSLEDAAEIVRCVFEQGFYEKKYTIHKKYTVTFRTRLTADVDRVLEQLEKKNITNNAVVAQTLSKYHLAASLQEFKGVSLRDKPMEEKVKLIEAMPDAVFRALSNKLADFDAMTTAALSEGAVENF